MACIAEVHGAVGKIHKSDEQRDKHALLIVFREGIIHAGSNLGRHHVLGSQRTEEPGGLSHKE